MKIPKRKNEGNFKRKASNNNNNRTRSQSNGRVTELLKLCLQKVCELQAEMEHEKNMANDPEAAGYAACAIETLRFLSQEGLPDDHPVILGLKEKFFSEK